MEAIVEYNYVAQEDDELTLKKGDIITGIKMMLGGWWEGTLRDKRGMFPDNFVKVLEPSTTSNSSSETTKCDEVTLRNGSSRRFCKVLFSYEPCNEDELTLKPQDAIEFLGEVEEGWWRGRLRGRVGVFPSNFVSDPEELGRHKMEMCQVLFPYEAANEDELTLAQGDVITLLSKDAPDKGWWKGELRGQIGLFPDNFVEIIGVKTDSQEEPQWHEATLLGVKSSTRHSHQIKRNEKAHVRKSLDRNTHPSSISDHFPAIDAGKVPSTSSSHMMISSSTIIGNNDKKAAAGSHSIISSLKRLVSDVGNNNGVANATNTFSSSSSECREELDGVERGEGAPLSHLTASRAKAPRRRPPSSQHLRSHQQAGLAGSMLPDMPTDSDVSILSDMPIHSDVPILSDVPIQPGVPIHPHIRKHPDVPIHSGETILPNVPSSELQILQEDSSNNRTNTVLEQADEETEGLIAKARQKTSWDAMVNELKMSQMERRKTTVDRVDKTEIKKERNFPRLMTQGNVVDSVNKPDTDNDDGKQKDKSPRTDRSPSWSSSGQPAYVPYVLYNKLLKRVDELEEKQAVLQMTVEQLSEQLIPLLANLSVNNKV